MVGDDGRTANGDTDLLDDRTKDNEDPNEISISSEPDSSDPNEISTGDDFDTPVKQSPAVTTNKDEEDTTNNSPTNDTEAEEIFSTPNKFSRQHTQHAQYCNCFCNC